MENEFDRIIGYGMIKRELARVADALHDSAPYAALGAQPPRGLLLYGPPGVGKSLMADCLIRASGRRVFLCRRDRADGEFIPAITAVFTEAAAYAASHAPAIVFLDDLDKFSAEEDGRCNEPEFTAVQSGVDGLHGKDVFVLATANELSVLPDSLTRPGRFDRIVRVDVPAEEDAAAIAAHYLAGKPLADDADCAVIARILEGGSCAALESAVNAAALLAAHERQEKIGMRHLLRACVSTIHDVSADALHPFASVDPDDGSRMAVAAWHEAGHAVVHEVLEPGSVTLAAIHEECAGQLGFVSCHTRRGGDRPAALMNDAAAALGGRAAVEARFGFLDCGAQHDLRQAADILCRLLTDVGTRGFACLDLPMRCSEEKIDRQTAVVDAELERCRELARRIVAENSGFLRAVAAALLERGILTSADIARLRRAAPVSLPETA